MDGRALEVRARESAPRCPYCHDLLAAAIDRVLCEKCGTPHHRACIEELERCATFGCGGAISEELEALRERVRRHAQQRAQTPSFDLERAQLIRPEIDRQAELQAFMNRGGSELSRSLVVAAAIVGLLVLLLIILR